MQGCKAWVGSPETHGTRVIHRVLVSGLCGKQPVALDNTCGIKLECELVAAAVAGVCASLDLWPCHS